MVISLRPRVALAMRSILSVKALLPLGLALSSFLDLVSASSGNEGLSVSDRGDLLSFSPSTGVSGLDNSTFGKVKETAASVLPNAYIIRLKKGARLSGRNTQDADAHDKFHKRAASQELSYSTRYEFKDSSLFFGLSIQLEEGDDASVEIIRDLPEVEDVWSVGVVERPNGANQVSFEGQKDERMLKAVNQTVEAASSARLNEPHEMTDLDRVHERGVKG